MYWNGILISSIIILIIILYFCILYFVSYSVTGLRSEGGGACLVNVLEDLARVGGSRLLR